MNTNSNEARPTKQPGYTWGTPCLMVENAEKAIETYTQVFGFTADNTMKDENGKINWAKLSYKDFGLHISDFNAAGCGEQKNYKSPKVLGIPSPVSIYLYNDNVEAIVEKAKKHSLQVIQEPEVMFWGDKMCIIMDENGYIWNFAKNVADFDPAKMPC